MEEGDKRYQLELNDIIHRYNGRTVLTVEHLPIERGKVYALVGPNGAGKTTLLHIMSLILRPDRGEVVFEGERIGYDESKRTHARRSMTMILQNPYLFRTTVKANIEYGLKARGMGRREREWRVGEALEHVGLSGFASRKAHELSGGEAQLVALARGLALSPTVLFLDEITANLDVKHVSQLEEVIKRINLERGTTIVMTTHMLNQAYRLADQVFSLFDGRIVSSTMYNLFKGEFRHDGEETLFDTGKIQIYFTAHAQGREKGHVSINPKDIIISKEPLNSSARNSFLGKITRIIEQNEVVHLGVYVGEEFRVQITTRSFHEMGLTLGSKVFLVFKASSVHLL